MNPPYFQDCFLDCAVCALGEAPTPLLFTDVFARYRGRWLHVRHRERTTWECPGGHIEPGETPLEGARRELYEEAGLRGAHLVELFDYWTRSDTGQASCRAFLATGGDLEDIPADFEMAERLLTDAPPEPLTYDFVYHTLFPLVERERLRRNLP